MKNLFYKKRPALQTRANIGLLVVLLLSLGLRLALPDSLFETEGRSRWGRIAAHVAQGQGYTLCWPEYFPFCSQGNEQTATAEPLPVLTYAAIMWLYDDYDEDGAATQGIVIFQSILSLATVILLYQLISRLLDSRPVALVGALLWGTYLPMIVVERDLLAEAIFIFFLMLSFLAFLYGLQRSRLWLWALTGLCFGLAVMSRSTLIYFLPLLSGFVLLLGTAPLRRRFLDAGLVILAFGVALAPWVIRNAQAFDAFIPDSTMKGYNLFRHNHIIAGDDYLRYVSLKEIEQVIEQRIEDGIRAGRTDVSGMENEYQMDRLYQAEALKIIRAHPGRYLKLSLYRLWPLLTDAGVGGPLNALGRIYGPINIMLFILAGMAVIRRRAQPRSLWPVITLIAFFVAGYMLVNARMRFILPVLPFVMALATDQGVYWLGRLGGKSQVAG